MNRTQLYTSGTHYTARLVHRSLCNRLQNHRVELDRKFNTDLAMVCNQVQFWDLYAYNWHHSTSLNIFLNTSWLLQRKITTLILVSHDQTPFHPWCGFASFSGVGLGTPV